MTASTAPPVPSPSSSRTNRARRAARIAALAVGLVVLATAAGFWFSPIGGRWRADAAGQAPAIGVATIDIVDSNFLPASVRIAAGDEVTWRWLDSQDHNVVFDDGEASAGRGNGTWSRTFDRPGAYAYSCTLHVFMDGRVVVDER